MIIEEMVERGDNWESIVKVCLADKVYPWDDVDFKKKHGDTPWYAVEFDSGYGGVEGIAFMLWTGSYVYFPIMYDGAEWVESVPRNPTDDVKLGHFGG